jgi:hypothetical protein
MMDTGQIALTSTMAVAVQQLQAINEMQMEIMQNIANSQQQMAALMHSAGIGQNVDVRV